MLGGYSLGRANSHIKDFGFSPTATAKKILLVGLTCLCLGEQLSTTKGNHTMNFEVLSHGDETMPGAEPQVNQLTNLGKQLSGGNYSNQHKGNSS